MDHAKVGVGKSARGEMSGMVSGATERIKLASVRAVFTATIYRDTPVYKDSGGQCQQERDTGANKNISQLPHTNKSNLS